MATDSHLVSLGLTWSHLVSLGFTWSHLVSLGLTWTHLVSLGLTWSLLDSLETMLFAGVLRTSATNGTGEQHHRRKRTGDAKSKQITHRAQQNTSERVQEAPERPSDLAEPLFKSFRQHSFAPTPRARGGARGGLFSLQTPASGSRTQEPLRFPGRTHPPTSDHYYCCYFYCCSVQEETKRRAS